MKNNKNDWKKYEKLVGQVLANQLPTNFCVTLNASIKGKFSLIKRQIDVLIDYRHDTDNKKRIIVDAKTKKRRIDVKDVESFIGMMEDTRATHGYLVCTSGYTKAAMRRAQGSINLRLLPLDKLDDFAPDTWPSCHAHIKCNGKVFWDGYPELYMDLNPIEMDKSNLRMSIVHYVGKCDKCRQFHVKCCQCNEILALDPYDEEHDGVRCQCEFPWFWIASIEPDDEGFESAELHVVELQTKEMKIRTVNRMSL